MSKKFKYANCIAGEHIERGSAVGIDEQGKLRDLGPWGPIPEGAIGISLHGGEEGDGIAVLIQGIFPESRPALEDLIRISDNMVTIYESVFVHYSSDEILDYLDDLLAQLKKQTN